MTWLTWRQFRTQAAAVYAAVAAVLVTLAATGPRLVDLAKLHTDLLGQLTHTDQRLFNAGIVLVGLAPAVVGAFWGAPLVARELESGTHRLVWNQSVTRTRWLAVKLGLTALATAVAVGLLTFAVTWWSSPIDGAVGSGRSSLPSKMMPVSFAMRGVAPVAYAVFAVMLGAAVGIVLRRTVPAMAVTLAVFAAVQLAVPTWVRPHLIAPERETVAMSRARLDGIQREGPDGPTHIMMRTADPKDWIVSSDTVDASGRTVALPAWLDDCLPGFDRPEAGSPTPARGGPEAIDGCLDRLTAAGYRQELVYHPIGRFWALQWAETALFLALSGLLAGFCFWWTRHRLS